MGLKKVYSLVLSLASAASLIAQDVHFSQYTAAPIALNPAMTANINGVFRLSTSYRNQWFQIPTLNAVSPYQTYQASFDMPILRDRLGDDAFGFGAIFIGDRAGDGALQTNTGLISVAYHKAVDRYGRSRISLGLQGGIVNKRININNLVFESQLDNFGWNRNLFNGETTFNNQSILYPDFNIGTMWSSAPLDFLRYYFGFSLFHVAKPKESFLSNEKNRLNHRYVAHGGAEIFVNRDQTFSLSPSFLFMLQANAQQYNVGLGLNYILNDDVQIFGGGYYRVKDAFIAAAGVEFYDTRLGLSYDVNLSNLKAASRAQGAIEVSLQYIFRKEDPGPIQYEKFCPNF